jgi:hypothetical protein
LSFPEILTFPLFWEEGAELLESTEREALNALAPPVASPRGDREGGDEEGGDEERGDLEEGDEEVERDTGSIKTSWKAIVISMLSHVECHHYFNNFQYYLKVVFYHSLTL